MASWFSLAVALGFSDLFQSAIPPWWLRGKESTYNAGDQCLIPESEGFSGEGNCNPLQYSGLENSMDRGAWLQSTGSQELDTTERPNQTKPNQSSIRPSHLRTRRNLPEVFLPSSNHRLHTFFALVSYFLLTVSWKP